MSAVPNPQVHHFHRASLRPVPWKNGGGTTLEAACEPAGSGTDDFEWRISIATVAADGSFSTFPGVDRSITLLHGPGLRLQSSEAGFDHALTTMLHPFSFAGEASVRATVMGGPSEDFNVMTRRSRWRSDVRVVRAKHEVSASDRAVWFAALGTWRLDLPGDRGVRLEPGAGCWVDAPLAGALVQPVSAGPSALIAVQLWSRT